MRKDRMKDNKKNNFAKRAGNTFFWAIVIAIILGVFWSSQNFFSARLKDVPISDVIARANKGEISKIEIQGNDVKVTKKGEKKPTEKSVKEAGTIYEQGLEGEYKGDELKEVNQSGTRMVC